MSNRDWPAFPVKGPTVNIFGFAGQVVSAAATQLGRSVRQKQPRTIHRQMGVAVRQYACHIIFTWHKYYPSLDFLLTI